MPNLDSNLATLRRGGWQEWYLAAFTGTAVLTGAVTADAADGATSLAYTTSTGSSANVKRGFLIRVTTAAGLLKGFWRVRASGTLNGTTMPITELSAGSVDINATDLIEVRNVILPGAKVTEADDDFNPDGLAAGTNNSAIPPTANAGPHDMGFVDSGQTYRTVTFPGSLSYAVDADSGGTLTYAWTAATATGTTTSTSANPSFTFPVGEHLVVLAVTDSSNSATWTTYRKVKVFDASTLPLDVMVESIDSDLESGTSARCRVLDSTPLASLPDGTLVGLFCREYINGVEQSFGNAVSGRSHIKALGYLRREDNANTAEDGTQELSFEIVSPVTYYRELVTGYSKVLQHNTAADAWNELDDLSFKRAIIEILRFYTWMTEFHDLVFHSSFDDRDYSTLFLQKSNPVDQIREFARAVDARVTCDRTGRFEVQMLPYAILEASRAAVTTWGTFTDSDRGDYSFSRDHWPNVEMVEGRALTDGTTTSNNQPIFARWPGLSPGSGLNNLIIDGLVADDQTDLNSRLGRLAEWEVGNYFTSTGVKHVALEGETTFPGSYFVFDPAYCEYLKLNFDDTTNLRGINLNDHRFIITRVSFTPDEQGSGTVTVNWRTATNNGAVNAVTYVPPQENDNGLPPWTAPGNDFGTFPPPVTGGLGKGTGTIAAMTDADELLITPDLTTNSALGGPTWAKTDLSALANWNGDLVDWVVDAFSPGYPGGGSVAGGNVNGWIATTTRILRIVDIFNSNATRAVTSQKTLRGTTAYRSLQFERGLQNWGICVSFYAADGVWATYTTDGSTWANEVQITAHRETSGTPNFPGIWIDPDTAGHAITSAFTATGAAGTATAGGYETFNYGATWAAVTSPVIECGQRLAQYIDIPFSGSQTTAYFHRGEFSGGQFNHRLRKSVGTTGSNIGPTVAATVYGLNPGLRTTRSHDSNPNQLLGILADDNVDPKIGVFKSLDGGATWTTVVTPSTANVGVYAAGAIGGDGLATYVWGTARFWYSPDFLLSIDDKTGNLAALGVTGTIRNLCGAGA